jgi:hypothetical protein|tara:strand:+ start:7326 stop:7598 length:273 start_codon:yes stop_codon:yes gene_type:complete
MRNKTLDQLRQSLLYHNTIDVWLTLSTEKQWNWRNVQNYEQFLNYIKNNQIELKKLNMKHLINKIDGKVVESFSIRLDYDIINKLRKFNL